MGGCSDVHIPSKGFIYKDACNALKSAPGVPEGAEPRPIEEARLSIGKNAAIVDLPYDHADSAGNTVSGSLTIHFKRVAREWTVEKTYATPAFKKPPTLESK